MDRSQEGPLRAYKQGAILEILKWQIILGSI